MAKCIDSGEIELLLKETSSYEIIGKDAETACFQIYHSASSSPAVKEAAKLKVIQSNLRFALKFAMDYHRITGMPVSDFYADGKLGLMDAFYRYDWTTGVKFGSYAVWYLRTRMGSSVQENDLVRVPVRLRKKVLKALKNGESVDFIRYGKEAEAAMLHTFSMDMPIEADSSDDDGSAITVGDTIPDSDDELMPDYGHSQELLREKLDEQMNSVLTLEESKLLRHMYGLDGEETSLDDAAAEIGSSKDWARRAKAKALAKLRESHALDDFAEGVY